MAASFSCSSRMFSMENSLWMTLRSASSRGRLAVTWLTHPLGGGQSIVGPLSSARLPDTRARSGTSVRCRSADREFGPLGEVAFLCSRSAAFFP